MVEILARSASKPSCTNAFVKATTTFEKSTAAFEKAVNAMKSLAGTGSEKVHLLLPSTAILMIHDLTNFNIVLWCSRYCCKRYGCSRFQTVAMYFPVSVEHMCQSQVLLLAVFFHLMGS